MFSALLIAGIQKGYTVQQSFVVFMHMSGFSLACKSSDMLIGYKQADDKGLYINSNCV